MKKFYDTENENIRLTSFTILQLIFEFSFDLQNNLGDKVHYILVSICLHLFDSNMQVKLICIDLIKLVATQTGILLTDTENDEIESFKQLKVSTQNESLVVQKINWLYSTFFMQHMQ